jgi:hypothetical protein
MASIINGKLSGGLRIRLLGVGGKEYLCYYDDNEGEKDVIVEIRDRNLILNPGSTEEKIVNLEEFLILVKSSIASRNI